MGRIFYEGGRAVGALRLSANPADGDTFTITPASGTTRIFEFDSGGGVTAGRVAVTIGGTVSETIDNLVAAINANKPVPAVSAYKDPIDSSTCRLEADEEGAAGNHGLTKSGANITLSDATMTEGENAGNQQYHEGEHVVTALDVSALACHLSTGLASPRNVSVECYTATGLKKAITSLITVVGGRIQVDFDGATNPAATDKLVWRCRE